MSATLRDRNKLLANDGESLFCFTFPSGMFHLASMLPRFPGPSGYHVAAWGPLQDVIFIKRLLYARNSYALTKTMFSLFLTTAVL